MDRTDLEAGFYPFQAKSCVDLAQNKELQDAKALACKSVTIFSGASIFDARSGGRMSVQLDDDHALESTFESPAPERPDQPTDCPLYQSNQSCCPKVGVLVLQ
jgi:hypothetical protein